MGGEDLAIGIACFTTPPPLTGDQTHTHTHTHTHTQGHVWPSGWVMRKVANGPGFEPSAKGGVSSKGPKLVFRIRAYVGATTVWGSSYTAYLSFHFSHRL